MNLLYVDFKSDDGLIVLTEGQEKIKAIKIEPLGKADLAKPYEIKLRILACEGKMWMAKVNCYK